MQGRPRFKLESLGPFPTTVTITSRMCVCVCVWERVWERERERERERLKNHSVFFISTQRHQIENNILKLMHWLRRINTNHHRVSEYMSILIQTRGKYSCQRITHNLFCHQLETEKVKQPREIERWANKMVRRKRVWLEGMLSETLFDKDYCFIIDCKKLKVFHDVDMSLCQEKDLRVRNAEMIDWQIPDNGKKSTKRINTWWNSSIFAAHTHTHTYIYICMFYIK